ncbi:MAG: GDSL-type esterase/lipase family protein [Pseudomonadota bacterium]
MGVSSRGVQTLPKVGEFDPLGKTKRGEGEDVPAQISPETTSLSPVHVHQPVLSNGGYVLAVQGAPVEPPLVYNAAVSTLGREDCGPMITRIDNGGDQDGKQRSRLAMAAFLSISVFVNAGLLGIYMLHEISVPKIPTVDQIVAKTNTLTGVASAKGDRPDIAAPVKNARLPNQEIARAKAEIRIEEEAALRAEIDDIMETDEAIVAEAGKVIPRPRPDLPRLASRDRSTANPAFATALRDIEAGTRSEPVTIVHIGDSHVASDSFSRGIRRALQERFGDAGRGAVVPANAFKYAQADGVTLASSGPWKASNSLRDRAGAYGVSGVRVSASSQNAVMTLKSKNGAFDWAEVTVLTGPKQGKVKISSGGKETVFNAKADKIGSKAVRLEAKGETLSVQPAGGGETSVLHWSSGRDTPGVRYVNFGIIGATAKLPGSWDRSLVQRDIERLDPQLIILGYGTNEGFNDHLNAQVYKRTVQGVVDLVSAAAPEADLMLLGPAAGARRTGSARHLCNGWRVPPKLSEVRDSLKEIASRNGALYWNWEEAMGGPCSIDQWARANPPLAAKDRVHLTARGYQQSARAFVKKLKGIVDRPQIVAFNQ